jgi:hypothetical protein
VLVISVYTSITPKIAQHCLLYPHVQRLYKRC